MLTREQLLNRPAKIETVPASELGDDAKIGVKLLSAAEFLKLSSDSKADPETAYAFWIIATACDETGRAIFTADDLEAVKGLPFQLVNRLIEKAQKINGTAASAAGN